LCFPESICSSEVRTISIYISTLGIYPSFLFRYCRRRYASLIFRIFHSYLPSNIIAQSIPGVSFRYLLLNQFSGRESHISLDRGRAQKSCISPVSMFTICGTSSSHVVRSHFLVGIIRVSLYGFPPPVFLLVQYVLQNT
jgi:hypothetical protein